jgi:hypothetical protein
MSSLAQPVPFRQASPPAMSRSKRLEHLILLPSFPLAQSSARDRLEQALGAPLARFLIAALSENQGRGVFSP